MRNKAAKQSAVDTYSNVFMSAVINSPRYYWSFDRLRNAECGFDRTKLRYRELDVVSIKVNQ